MYLSYFGLREFPFNLTPDVDFAFHARPYQEALNTLLLALANGEGFLKVTGEVGTGKTLLCRWLLDQFGDDTVSAYLPNPNLNPHQMLRALAGELGQRLRPRDEADPYRALERRLLTLATGGHRVLLCIDEAQALPIESLETLRLLSNLETGKNKLLQIVLFGQPEFDTLLERAPLRSLASRITFSARLTPLSADAASAYLEHRLTVAGWSGPMPFSPPASRLLWLASGGVPRRINALAHKSLLLAFGAGTQRVNARMVWQAWRDAAPTPGTLRALAWPLRAALWGRT